MKKKLIFFLLLSTILIYADRVNSLSAYFSYTVVSSNQNSPTISVGNLWYFNYTLFMEVKNPIHQILIFSGNKLTIYYPEEKKAFLITSKIPQMLPLFSVFLMSFETDFGLTHLGFKLKKTKKQGKIISFYFEPDKRLRKIIKYYVINLNKDKNPSLIEVINPKNRIISKTFLKKFIMLKNLKIPTFLITRKFFPQKEVEKLSLSDISINEKIPDRIRHFQLPKNIELKEIKW